MKRVLALAGAALLVVIAVLVRGALDDDGDDVTADNGDDDEPTELVVACIPELEDACRQLDGVATLRVEDPGATIENPDDVDAWITLDPWPDIAATARAPDRLTQDALVVASSPLLLLLRTDALEGCDDWACAGDSQRAALPMPSSALGRLALGHAASEWSSVTRPNEPFAAQEFALPEFQRWLGAIDFSRDPVDDMLVLANAGPRATAITAAAYDADVSASPRAEGLATSRGAGAATVVAVVTGSAADSVRDQLEIALLDQGWEPAASDARSEGMPSAGVLFALAQEVS